MDPPSAEASVPRSNESWPRISAECKRAWSLTSSTTSVLAHGVLRELSPRMRKEKGAPQLDAPAAPARSLTHTDTIKAWH